MSTIVHPRRSHNRGGSDGNKASCPAVRRVPRSMTFTPTVFSGAVRSQVGRGLKSGRHETTRRPSSAPQQLLTTPTDNRSHLIRRGADGSTYTPQFPHLPVQMDFDRKTVVPRSSRKDVPQGPTEQALTTSFNCPSTAVLPTLFRLELAAKPVVTCGRPTLSPLPASWVSSSLFARWHRQSRLKWRNHHLPLLLLLESEGRMHSSDCG